MQPQNQNEPNGSQSDQPSPVNPSTQPVAPPPPSTNASDLGEVSANQTYESDKSYVVTFILSFLLGTFGADRFYTGKTVSAIFKLITLGGLGIWVIIDLFLLIFGKFKDNKGRKLQGYDQNKLWTRILLIVLLVFNIITVLILASLVITTSSGIQRKAADSERQVDINSIHSQLEAYSGSHSGQYPSLAQLNDSNWVTANMPGLDLLALYPNGGNNTSITTEPGLGNYAYVATSSTGESCDGKSVPCVKYTLTAVLESGGTYVKMSLN